VSEFSKWFNPFNEKIGQASKLEAIEYTFNEQQSKIDKLEADNKLLREELEKEREIVDFYAGFERGSLGDRARQRQLDRREGEK